jgi:hypothetical protein
MAIVRSVIMLVLLLLRLFCHRLLDPYSNPARSRHDPQVPPGETPIVRRIIAALTLILMECPGDIP